MSHRRVLGSASQKPGIDHAEKPIHEKAFATRGWLSFDPADIVRFSKTAKISCETFPKQMNTVDLERLKEREDAVVKSIDSWPRIFQLLIYRQLYALGIRIDNIDSEIKKELKKYA